MRPWCGQVNARRTSQRRGILCLLPCKFTRSGIHQRETGRAPASGPRTPGVDPGLGCAPCKGITCGLLELGGSRATRYAPAGHGGEPRGACGPRVPGRPLCLASSNERNYRESNPGRRQKTGHIGHSQRIATVISITLHSVTAWILYAPVGPAGADFMTRHVITGRIARPGAPLAAPPGLVPRWPPGSAWCPGDPLSAPLGIARPGRGHALGRRVCQLWQAPDQGKYRTASRHVRVAKS